MSQRGKKVWLPLVFIIYLLYTIILTHINEISSIFKPISTSDSCACLWVPKWLSEMAAFTIHQRPPAHKCSWGITCVTASLSPATSSSCLLSYLSLEVTVFSCSGELDSFRRFGWVRWWSTFRLCLAYVTQQCSGGSSALRTTVSSFLEIGRGRERQGRGERDGSCSSVFMSRSCGR